MRDGWIGNEVLQNALQRPDPQAGVVLEAVRTVNEDVRATLAEWQDGTGSGFKLLRSGGLKLTGTNNTVAQGATTQADEIVTDMAIDHSFFAMRIIWADLIGVNDRELDSLTIRVDPSAGGGAVEVTEWRAQLYRLSETTITGVALQPISAMVSVPHGGGASQQDVTFDFLSADLGNPVRIGPDPVDRFGNVQAPRTYLFVWAIKGDGEAAGNVAWMGDAASNSQSSIAYAAKPVNLLRLGTGSVAETGSTFVENDADGVAGGLPWFELEDVSFSAATRSMLASNADDFDLGASPTEDVEVVVGTQIPPGCSITTELAVPGSGTWVEVADGDIIGQDNTSDGGNDLSGLAVRQDYDARVTLTPPSGSYTSPVIRRFGIRERESTVLHELATLRNSRQAVDPVDLHAEIGSAEIEIIKDGVTDYRDFFSEFFSDNHIGQVEFRAWVGGRDIPRRYWLHLDDYLVDDTTSRGAAGIVPVLNSLVLLKGILPDPTSSPREPLEYSNQTISTVRSDILSNQMSIENRRIGTGPVDIQIDSDADGTDDTDALVTNRLEEADAKPELDALAFLAGGAEISSQGRVKTIQLHNPADEDDSPHPVDLIPLEEGAVGEISPGYSERVDEFFVSWGWDETANEGRGKYLGDERAFHSPGITKLGSQALRGGSVPRLDDRIAKWIPQSGTDGSGDPYSGLARKVSTRQVQTLGVGMITVPVQSTIARPHLELGDVIAVETDRFVGKDPNSDRGIRGKSWLIGPVVAIDDPLGRNLTVWVRSYADILASSTNVQRQSYVTPRVYSVQPSFSNTGVLSVSVVARIPDSGSVKVAASSSSYPTETTVDAQSAQALDSEGAVLVGSLGTFAAGETAFISVKAYENADGTGAESFEVFQVQAPRLTYVEPEITGDLTETETAGTGTFVIRDEALRAQAVEFQTKVGAGPWGGTWLSSWDSSTGTAGSDKNLERVEAVTKHEKHVTGIKARLTYLDADGVSREKFAVLAVDPERVAQILSATISFDESGNVDVQVEGDEDCANIYVTVGDGSAPSDPTSGTNDGSVAGSAGLIETTVSVTDGGTAIVKVVGENSQGSLGPVRTYRAVRGDPRPTGAIALDLDDTGAASALGVGGSRVQSWKVAAAIGSAPSDATIRAATAIDQQSIDQGDVGTLVTASPGERVYLGAFCYDQTSGAGRESQRLDDTELFGVTNDGIDDRAVDSPKLALAGVERENLVDDIIDATKTEYLDGAAGVVDQLEVRGTGNNNIANRRVVVGGRVDVDGTSRGVALSVLSRADHTNLTYRRDGTGTGTLAANQVYDLFGSDADRQDLRDALIELRTNINGTRNSLPWGDDIIVVLTSHDAVDFAAGAGSSLVDEMLLHGATNAPRELSHGAGTHRTPYALVGIPGIQEGRGIEIITGTGSNDPHAEFSGVMFDGLLFGLGGFAKGVISAELLAAEAVVAGKIAADAVTATEINIAELSELADDVGIVLSGELRNAAGTRYLDLDASGANPFIAHDNFRLDADGDAEFGGTVYGESFTGSNPVFSGSVEVEAGEGDTRVRLAASSGAGIVNVYDSSGSISATMQGGSTAQIFSAFGIRLVVQAGSGLSRLTLSGEPIWIDADEIRLFTLPTSDPAVSGQLWNDGGTVKVSAG